MSWWTTRHATSRTALIEALGGACARADATCEGGLEIDHIHGRDYKVETLSSHMRVKRYKAEAAEGLLQVLCRHHNAQKGATLEQGCRRRAAVHALLPQDPPAWFMEETL